MLINTDFHFQEWALLAQVDPEAFEIRRRTFLDQFLRDSSDRQRMLGQSLQREIDAARSTASDPRAALSVISKMLWQHVSFLCEGLNDFSDYLKKLERASVPGVALPAALPTRSADHRDTIIPIAFPTSKPRR